MHLTLKRLEAPETLEVWLGRGWEHPHGGRGVGGWRRGLEAGKEDNIEVWMDRIASGKKAKGLQKRESDNLFHLS